MVKGRVLSVKIGIGLGECKILFVGGVFKRNEYLIVGESMRQACRGECSCKTGGETYISELVYDRIKEYYSFSFPECDTNIEATDKLTYYKCLSFVKSKIATRAKTMLMRYNFSPLLIREKMNTLTTYIPAAVCPYIEIGKEKWSKENRLLTIMFINLAIDLKDTDSDEKMLHVQDIIETVQKCVYKTRGSLNKFLMDDKGSVLLIAWGLPPMSNYDDSARAVRTGLDIIKELRKEHLNCGAKIGITTGCCFTGICGSIGGRREYSLLGEIVNKAARYMQKSMMISEKKRKKNPNDVSARYQILVCDSTKKLIENKIPTRFVCCDYIKGFEAPFNFYEPLEKERFDNIISNEIRTHTDNPIPDLAYSSKAIFSTISIKNSNEVDQLFKLLVDNHLSKTSVSILIKGVIGTGKSFLLRNVLDRYYRSFQLQLHPKEKFLFCSMQNPSSYSEPGNGISSIMKEIYKALIPYCDNTKKKVKLYNEFDIELDEIGSLLTDSLCLSYVHYIEEIIDVSLSRHYDIKEESNAKEIYTIREIEHKEFYERRKYPLTLCNKINGFFYQLIKLYRERVIPSKPLIIIIEDCHVIDDLSFEFIKMLSLKKDSIQQMTLICSYQISFNPFDKQNISFFDFVNTTIEMNPLRNNLKDFIITYIREVKHINKCSSIHSEVEEIIRNFTISSPLLLGELLSSLIDEGYLVVHDSTLKTGKNFSEMSTLSDFTSIKIPFLIEKIVGNIIDSLSPIESIILKYASVIGKTFDIDTLYTISTDSQLSFENLVKVIYSFHFNGIIDILYDLDVMKIVARFSVPFLREVLYQRMTVETRNSIHFTIARKMLVTRSSYLPIKKELIVLKSHLIEAERSISERMSKSKHKDTNDSTEKKNQNMYVIKELCNRLKAIDLKIDNSSKEIIAGLCQKKNGSNITWDNRYIICTKNKFEYWKSKIDYEDNALPLGSVLLKNVYKVYIGKDIEVFFQKKNILVVKVSSYLKKNEIKEDKTFYFSFQSYKELHSWLTILNFMKVKANYDELCFNYGVIPLPLSHEIKEKERRICKKQFTLCSLDTQFLIPGYNYPLELSSFDKTIPNSNKKKLSVYQKYFVNMYRTSEEEKKFQSKKKMIFSLIKIGLVHFIGSIQRGISTKPSSSNNSLIKIDDHTFSILDKYYLNKRNIIKESDSESFSSNDQKYSILSSILRNSNLSYNKVTSIAKMMSNMSTEGKKITSEISEKEIEESRSKSYSQSLSKRSRVISKKFTTSDFTSCLEQFCEE